MQEAAEPGWVSPAAPERPALRVIPTEDPGPVAMDELVLRLAADRLRDLRDDGVTTAYIARMYGVSPEVMGRIAARVLPG